MDFTLYKQTELEIWINAKYREHGIHYASDINIDSIAAIFNVNVMTTKNESKVIWDEDDCLMFINGYMCEEQKREVFFHELAHPIKHVGNQHVMPQAFIELQELQAAQFQLYASMPIYMLEEFSRVSPTVYEKVIREEFQLPESIVRRRLEQIQRRIQQERFDLNFIASSTPVKLTQEYTTETQRILNQLHKQLKNKGA